MNHSRFFCGCAAFLSMIVSTSALSFAQDRATVPSDSAQQQARKLIDEIYGDEITKARTSEEKNTLAKKLLATAAESPDAVNRYVLLTEAGRLAMDAGEVQTALQAVVEIDKHYFVDAFTLKGRTVSQAEKSASSTGQHKAVAEQSMALAREAVRNEDFVAAKYLCSLAVKSARKARIRELPQQAVALGKEVEEIAGAFEEIKEDLATLENNPTDPNANLSVGKYRCFFRGDWDDGLPMLVLGSEPTMKVLAVKELRGVAAPREQAALADGWWDLAEGEKGTAREQLRAHAVGWYKRALPQLEGLEKVKAEKRLKEAPGGGGVLVHTPGRPPVAAPVTARSPKELSIDLGEGVKMEFVLIPAGEFMMGSPEAERQMALTQETEDWAKNRISSEGPQHKVTLSKPFYLGKYEVTQAQWQAVMGNNPSQFKGPTNPVEKVSWEDIQPFLAKMNATFEKKGRHFGLPTEAGWEYACRAGTTTAYHFGDSPTLLAQHGWFKGNSGGTTHPVGQGQPNKWGLYDMHGNVWEWCSDWYGAEYYAKSPPLDPMGPPKGSNRVSRGGAWGGPPRDCRAAFRRYAPPGHRDGYLGFRLMCVPSRNSP
jgi:formylglycine-generating enzyme required for sulfatase activity